MNRFRTGSRHFCAALLFLSAPAWVADAQQQVPHTAASRQFWYNIEWRMITAGTANLSYERAGADTHINLDLESAGLVSRLYSVTDKYRVTANAQFCPATADLDAQEGKKHNVSHLSFDNTHHKLDFIQRDLVKNQTIRDHFDVAPCTYEIAGALAALGQMDLQPGHSTTLPITDGKKVVRGRIEAQAKEPVVLGNKTYQAIRYEAFLFDNVLYKRRGRLFIWISDDADRVPLQFRMQLGFPIGTISVELDPNHR